MAEGDEVDLPPRLSQSVQLLFFKCRSHIAPSFPLTKTYGLLVPEGAAAGLDNIPQAGAPKGSAASHLYIFDP